MTIKLTDVHITWEKDDILRPDTWTCTAVYYEDDQRYKYQAHVDFYTFMNNPKLITHLIENEMIVAINNRLECIAKDTNKNNFWEKLDRL